MADQLSNDFQKFQDVIDQQVKLFGDHIIPFLSNSLEKNDVKATLQLIQSLRKDFVKQQAQAAVLTVSFKKYGTAVESKRYFANKAPAEELREWVEIIRQKGGLKKVPGYVTGKAPTEAIAINRILWAIKNYKGAKRRSKVVSPWFYKPFYGELRKFSNDLGKMTTQEVGSAVYRLIDRGVQKMNSNG